jgi:ribonuclease HI
MTIEIAFSKGWHNLWLETDSQLVMMAFNSKSMIPWDLRNRWINCLELVKQMIFLKKKHMYRQGNSCADGFANLGFRFTTF